MGYGVILCDGRKCSAKSSADAESYIREQIDALDIQNTCVNRAYLCESCRERYGLLVLVKPGNSRYICIDKEDVTEVLREHLYKNRVVDRLLITDYSLGDLNTILDKMHLPLLRKRSDSDQEVLDDKGKMKNAVINMPPYAANEEDMFSSYEEAFKFIIDRRGTDRVYRLWSLLTEKERELVLLLTSLTEDGHRQWVSNVRKQRAFCNPINI